MSGTLMDEMYKENKLKASAKANKISLGIIFLSLIILGQGRIMVNLDFTLIAFVIVVALAIALEIFLNQYLLYRYDHNRLKKARNKRMPDFECRLKKFRQLKDLTQEELAIQVGVRRETIMRLEKAQYNPSLKLAIDISRAVGAPIEEIFIFD